MHIRTMLFCKTVIAVLIMAVVSQGICVMQEKSVYV